MKEKKLQKTTWKGEGFPDLRNVLPEQRLPAAEVVATGATVADALQVLAYHLELIDCTERYLTTPKGEVRIARDQLLHIVEKRQDARERYVKYALATIENPFEIWQIEYEDDAGNETLRYAFIGVFEGKTQMLVVFAEVNGKLLWNFMHGDSKALNKHRHGECIYRRI